MEIEHTHPVPVATSTTPDQDAKSPKKKNDFPQMPTNAADSQVLPDRLVRRLVLSYLLRNCYCTTALAFVASDPEVEIQQNGHTPSTNSPTDTTMSDDAPAESEAPLMPSITPVELEQLDQRRAMMDRILSGDICGGIELAESLLSSPSSSVSSTTVKDAFPKVYLRLLCQHFVELMRQRKPIDAISFARHSIAPLGKSMPSGLPLLQDYLPLLAYMDPEKSPMFEQLDTKHRESLAEELNGHVYAYLHHHPKEKKQPIVHRQSELERLMRQLSLLMNKLPPKEGKEKEEERPKWTLADALEESKTEPE